MPAPNSARWFRQNGKRLKQASHLQFLPHGRSHRIIETGLKAVSITHLLTYTHSLLKWYFLKENMLQKEYFLQITFPMEHGKKSDKGVVQKFDVRSKTSHVVWNNNPKA